MRELRNITGYIIKKRELYLTEGKTWTKRVNKGHTFSTEKEGTTFLETNRRIKGKAYSVVDISKIHTNGYGSTRVEFECREIKI